MSPQNLAEERLQGQFDTNATLRFISFINLADSFLLKLSKKKTALGPLWWRPWEQAI